MKTAGRILVVVIAAATALNSAWARPWRPAQVPNGTTIGCILCHTSAGGGDARNAFGKTVERSFLSNGNVVWGPLLASLDSDGDGIPNGTELLDPYGQWQSGQANPGNPSDVTAPGNTADNHRRTLTVQFSGMDPHVGQFFGLRVVDKATGKEIGRTLLASVPGSSFDVAVNGIYDGGSYWVDFWSDASGNSVYDAPPADHAWRISVNNTSGNTSAPFSHNTDFTDIAWTYMLTLNATGMSSHTNKLFELRVVDTESSLEVGRARVEVLGTSAFFVTVPGIQIGHSYNVDFFSDNNNNGLYDATPTDHAWRMNIADAAGDVALDFAQNTNYTDVAWKYLMQMNLLNMNPHLDNMFELRVVNPSNSTEIGRTSVATISVPNFTVSVPGILRQTAYNADFYADMNGNGTYDAPPTDHAWRQALTSTTGNIVLNFTHNTNFTDIQWPVPLEPPTAATNPSPAHEATNVELNVVLTWTPGDRATSHSLYFGTSNPPPFVVTTEDVLYIPPQDLEPNTDYYWQVDEVNDAGETEGTLWTFHTREISAVGENGTELPSTYALKQNFPNPFNPTTSIAFDLPQSGFAKLAVYNLNGQQVAELANGPMAAGHYNVEFNGAGLASGVYIYRLETNSFAAEKKMMLMK